MPKELFRQLRTALQRTAKPKNSRTAGKKAPPVARSTQKRKRGIAESPRTKTPLHCIRAKPEEDAESHDRTPCVCVHQRGEGRRRKRGKARREKA
jgi:hypothetical protein